jgi:hypothetical protein
MISKIIAINIKDEPKVKLIEFQKFLFSLGYNWYNNELLEKRIDEYMSSTNIILMDDTMYTMDNEFIQYCQNKKDLYDIIIFDNMISYQRFFKINKIKQKIK